MTNTTRRLRVQSLVINVALVWDDGDELTPGPQIEPVVLPLSQLAAFAEVLPSQLQALAAQEDTAPADGPDLVHEAGDVRIYRNPDGSHVLADPGGWRPGTYSTLNEALAAIA